LDDCPWWWRLAGLQIEVDHLTLRFLPYNCAARLRGYHDGDRVKLYHWCAFRRTLTRLEVDVVRFLHSASRLTATRGGGVCGCVDCETTVSSSGNHWSYDRGKER
jgi:hypothetical protein